MIEPDTNALADDTSGPAQPTNTLSLLWWQEELLLDTTSDVIAVTGGYGSAKTFGSVLWLYNHLQRNPGCDALYIQPQYSLIKRVAIPAINSVFAVFGLVEGVHYSVYTSNDNPRVELCNSQVIYLLSAERPEAIVGITTVCGMVIDEAGLCAHDAYLKAMARLRTKQATQIQALLTGTPEGINWFCELFDSDSQAGWEHRRNGRDSSKQVVGEHGVTTYRRIRATTFANQHNLKGGYINNLFETWGHNKNYIDSYVYGYFRPFATGLAYNYEAAKHKIKYIEPSPHIPLYLSWDYNICPQWVSIQQHRDEIGRNYYAAIHNADEGHEQLDDSVIEFALKHPVAQFRDTPILLCGDSTGHHKSHKSPASDYLNIKTMLHKLGYRRVDIIAIHSNPLERTSVDLVNKALSDSAFRISERCGKVLTSITRTAWKDGERAKLDKPAGDNWTHPMDAVKYFFCALHDAGRKKILTR